MARSEGDGFGRFLIGPVLIGLASLALWKNEGRFDYHRAAKEADVIESIQDAESGQLISFTDSMDPKLTLHGDYVDKLVGYLEVRRNAEIYAWDEDEDEDGNVTWSKQWMGTRQSNSRNRGIEQKLSSIRFMPESYQVGEMPINADRIEFVDSAITIPPSGLTLTEIGSNHGLRVSGQYLYLRKQSATTLGDERVSYQGIPVPAVATYFGKIVNGRGTVHQAIEKGGLIDNFIQDRGVLHHLVKGDRDESLQTIKGYITRIKWMVRAGGIICLVIGFACLASAFAAFLFHVPVIGSIVQAGTLLASAVLGVSLGATIIIASHLFHHPLILLTLIVVGGLLFYFLRRRGQASQQALKQRVDQQYGHVVTKNEFAELEFIELAQLAYADREFDDGEKSFLIKWAKKRGWDQDKTRQMISRAKKTLAEPSESTASQPHLENLIRLSLADGSVTSYELRVISDVAKGLGYSGAQVTQLMKQVGQTASV